MDLISVAEAARRMGVSDRRVRQLIDSGALKAVQVGRAYVIDAKAVAKYRPQPIGRPPKPRRP